MRGDIRGVCKNLRYALTIICKASPTRLLVTMLESVLRGTALFMLDVYLLRVIVNSVQAGSDFGGLAATTLWIAGYYGAVQILRTSVFESRHLFPGLLNGAFDTQFAHVFVGGNFGLNLRRSWYDGIWTSCCHRGKDR